ncbi:MAG: sulfotransferase domain-containing protein [Litoreibacter sp.]|nr:sulfotransferase domain-containing protein [Litoreibacter sp.]
MDPAYPQRTRIYQNHHLDSTRWDVIEQRPNDIIVSTAYKCGTTWTQTIVLHLIFQDLEFRQLSEFSPWIEFRRNELQKIKETVANQTHRRCLKSHVPADAVPYSPDARYVVVGRDARDVFMSMWNHYSNYTEEAYAEFNNPEGRVGGDCPRCPADIHDFWSSWITRGWFDWETDGYPFWSNFRHIQSWWDFRHLENVHFVHYNDLLDKPREEIAALADFLGIACSEEMLGKIVEATSFRSMKSEAEKIAASTNEIFNGGAKTFINKGTNGRWISVLTDEDLEKYETAVTRTLSPDCRSWLEARSEHAESDG